MVHRERELWTCEHSACCLTLSPVFKLGRLSIHHATGVITIKGPLFAIRWTFYTFYHLISASAAHTFFLFVSQLLIFWLGCLSYFCTYSLNLMAIVNLVLPLFFQLFTYSSSGIWDPAMTCSCFAIDARGLSQSPTVDVSISLQNYSIWGQN